MSGAVAVLFLFVVMMINFKLDQQKFYLPECFIFWLLTSLNLIYTVEVVPVNYRLNFFWGDKSNFYSLGSYLYGTQTVLLVGVVGLVLFVAMVGAISLTYISSENYRSQNIPTQTRRTSSLYRLEKNFYQPPLQSGFLNFSSASYADLTPLATVVVLTLYEGSSIFSLSFFYGVLISYLLYYFALKFFAYLDKQKTLSCLMFVDPINISTCSGQIIMVIACLFLCFIVKKLSTIFLTRLINLRKFLTGAGFGLAGKKIGQYFGEQQESNRQEKYWEKRFNDQYGKKLKQIYTKLK